MGYGHLETTKSLGLYYDWGVERFPRVERLPRHRYYSLVHDIIKKYDRRALILGDRFPSFYYPEVVRACVPYVDAVSCNLKASWNDGTFTRFSLDTLHALSGKPLIVGEFYLCARDNRSGNKNSHGMYPMTATQKERGLGFRNTILSLVGVPWIIGADWFQYYDQPTHGRFDGENFNFGLVDINDRPYEALASVASTLDLAGSKTRPLRARKDVSHGVPPAPRDPFNEFELSSAFLHWDRERGFVKPVSELPLADLYVCWNKRAVYLGLYAQDVVEDVFYKGNTVLSSDRSEWIISIKGLPKPIRGRIGSGMEPVVDEPTVRLMNLSGINGNTRNIAGMEIPAMLFGQDRFKSGDAIEFASVFFTHGRAYRVDWKGRYLLSK